METAGKVSLGKGVPSTFCFIVSWLSLSHPSSLFWVQKCSFSALPLTPGAAAHPGLTLLWGEDDEGH